MTFSLVLKIILSYLLPWTIGFLVLNLLDQQSTISRGYKLFSSLFVGSGLFTLEIFTLGIFGTKLTLTALLILLLATLAILMLATKLINVYKNPRLTIIPARVPPGIFTKFSGREKILLIVLGLILLFRAISATWQITHYPVYEFDAWNNWDLRGKVIYTEKQLILDKTSPFYLGGGISSYPLNDGLWKVWAADMIGGWQEGFVNLYSLIFYLGLLGIFFFALPAKWSRSFRLLATYLLGSLPFLYFHSWVAYADLEFATYLFLALSTLYWFLQTGSNAFLYVSALGLGGTIWTKNEGFAVVLPIILLVSFSGLILKKTSVKTFIIYWLTALGSVLPWLIFRFGNRLDILSGQSSSFKIVFNSQFLDEWFSSIFLRSHFNFLYLLFFILAIYAFRSHLVNFQINFLLVTFIFLFLLYNGIILFTDKAYDLGALARVNLQIAPIAWFATILLLHKLIFKENHEQ